MSTIVQTGFKLAQTVISNGAITGNEWSNPNNLLLTDGDLSESNPGAGVASDVVIGNFLAQVPANAVITGIELQIIGKAGAQISPVLTLTPYALDNTSGTDNYYPYITPFTGLTPDIASYVLGSSTYLFATDWTPDMINNFKLQFVANGDLYIDSALLNVFYYVPDSTSGDEIISDSCADCNSPIQAQPFYLAQPFLSGDRYAYLQSFNYPDGTPIQYADLGSCGGYITLVFDPAVPKVGTENFEENAKTAVWDTMPDGTVRLDFVDVDVFRGLMFHTPYTADALLRSNHDQNSKVIISDSAPFLGQYLQRCQIGALISAPIEVDSNGTQITKPAVKLNFTGAGVVPTQDLSDPEQVNINIPGGAGTTPPLIVSSESATSGSVQVPSLTFSIDSIGINRAIVVQVCTEQAQTITGVTFNGIPLIQEVSETDATNLRTEQWILVAPTLGTHNIVVTLSAPAYISAGAEILTGVDQSTPVGAISSAFGTSLTPSTTLVTSYNNSIILSSLVTGLTPILYTPGSGQTSNWFQTANADTRQGASAVEESGSAPDSVILDYTITQNTPWCMTGLEIKGITLAPPVVASLTVEDLAAGVIVPNTTLLVFPTGSVANPLPGKAVVTFPGTVLVDGSDTTENFLDDKIEIVSADLSVTIVKSIENPGADEKISYDLSVAPAAELTTLFQQSIGTAKGANLGIGVASSVITGLVPGGDFYAVQGAVGQIFQLIKFTMDLSGTIYYTGVTVNVAGGAALNFCYLTVIGTHVYVSSIATSGGAMTVYRYDIGTLANETLMTIGAGGTGFLGEGCFTDNTFFYAITAAATADKYSISGTNLTWISTITFTSMVTAAPTWSDGVHVYQTSGTITINKWVIAGGARTQITKYANSGNPGANVASAAGWGLLGVTVSAGNKLMYWFANNRTELGTVLIEAIIAVPISYQ